MLANEMTIVPTETLPVQKIKADITALKNFELFRIEEVTYEKTAPRKEALENVVSALRLDGVNFIYLLIGNREEGVSFYFGVSRDLYENKPLSISLDEIADGLLKTSILGNFRGSSIKKVERDEKEAILDLLNKRNKLKYVKLMQGIPGINKDDEEFQAVNRLVDVMQNDNFAFMLVAKPLQDSQIIEMENEVYELYNVFSSYSKVSQQVNFTEGSSKGQSQSEGTSSSKSSGTSSSTSNTESSSHTTSSGESTSSQTSRTSNGSKTSSSTSQSGGTNSSESDGTSTSKATTEGYSENTTRGTNQSTSETISNSTSSSTSGTVEMIDKRLQDWLKFYDEVLLPRLDYSKGKGLFVTSALLFTERLDQMQELQATLRALYSGESGNKNPLKIQEIENKELLLAMSHFQLPHSSRQLVEEPRRCVFAAYSRSPFYSVGNLYSARELSLIAGLPQKEVRGLPLRAEVEFGLNSPLKTKDSILMGNLVQSGNVLDKQVYLDKNVLDKHIFVTGVTGSGKTTTCQRILIESGLPFCVIEPAKTEYRVLKNKIKDLHVFTLGDDSTAPFRLNPFELLPNESLSSHVDMLKACFEAAFDMEAAIPQVVEATIYKIYKKKGWNERTEKNDWFKNPYEKGVNAFPTISDFVETIGEVVLEQGFDDRLRDEYIGSIKARFQSLMHGSKGKMLNTPRSIDFEKLLDGHIVLELESIRNGDEKALVMGFILSTLGEVIKRKYENSKEKNKDFKHITLVEEAHRLLSKWMPGDSMNKKQGVETFADMLAEVRKYGECLIIADQIPNKLTSDVLKNTNTKIVHRLFAKDDKDSIGNTMALDEEQKDFLSSLETGRAIMFSQSANPDEEGHKSVKWNKPIQIKVCRTKDNDTERKPTSKDALRKDCLHFYASQLLQKALDDSTLEVFANEILNCNLAENFYCYMNLDNKDMHKNSLLQSVNALLESNIPVDYLTKYICQMFYAKSNMLSQEKQRIKHLEDILINRTFEKLLNDDLFRGSKL